MSALERNRRAVPTIPRVRETKWFLEMSPFPFPISSSSPAGNSAAHEPPAFTGELGVAGQERSGVLPAADLPIARSAKLGCVRQVQHKE